MGSDDRRRSSAPTTKPAPARLPLFPAGPDAAARRDPGHQQREHRRDGRRGARRAGRPRARRAVQRAGRGARDRRACAAHADIVAYVDADCRAPITWLERVEAQFSRPAPPLAVTGPYRFYDWDWSGRALVRAYDLLVAPPTHALVHHGFGVGAILYGGNFAVRSDALARIGGFDRRIEFHGEDTNLGRRLTRDRARRAVPASAGSGRPRAGIARWASGRCSASTCGISGPRSSATVRRIEHHLDVRA